ncbi:hypothetical protein ACIQI7_21125 [Kitasatospora sp. NPDC092039]|uniref:hypothetical protein n=1 Tax=Kitasatospora sp. NPDC092039 TaxID=3364086 RepID=UPI00381850A3
MAEPRELVEETSRAQFTTGDYALEAEPMREPGGSVPAEDQSTAKSGLVAGRPALSRRESAGVVAPLPFPVSRR